MKFIPSRELRLRPGKVWKDLKAEGELVVTSNGQPVALMLPVSGRDLEEQLRAARRARFADAVDRIRRDSQRRGVKLSMAEIDEEIASSRRERAKGK